MAEGLLVSLYQVIDVVSLKPPGSGGLNWAAAKFGKPAFYAVAEGIPGRHGGIIRFPSPGGEWEKSDSAIAKSENSDYVGAAMEQEMRIHLRCCAENYASARGIGLPTVGRLAAGDWRFFERVQDDEKTFTARKYDEVIRWFSDNWPETAPWPPELKRPDPLPPLVQDDPERAKAS